MYRDLQDFIKKNKDLTVSQMLKKAEDLGIATKPRHSANKSQIYAEIRRIENGNTNQQTLCWNCENINCSWMREFKPVDGWIAYPQIIDNKEGRLTSSYLVINCPGFKQGRIL